MQPKQLFPDSSTYTRTPWIQAKLRTGFLVGVKCYLHLKIKTRICNASYDFWSNVSNIGHSLTNSRQKVSRLFSASATVHYLICKSLRIVSNRPTEVPLTKDHSHSLLSFQVITTNYALKGSYMTLICEGLFSLSVSFGNYR